MIAGTAFTLNNCQGIISDTGKTVIPKYLSGFQVFGINNVETYIKRFLDLSDCEVEDIKDWNCLAGRPRLAARFVLEVVRSEREHGETKTKQAVVEEALLETINAFTTNMTDSLMKLVNYSKKGGREHDNIRRILRTVFIQCRYAAFSSLKSVRLMP